MRPRCALTVISTAEFSAKFNTGRMRDNDVAVLSAQFFLSFSCFPQKSTSNMRRFPASFAEKFRSRWTMFVAVQLSSRWSSTTSQAKGASKARIPKVDSIDVHKIVPPAATTPPPFRVASFTGDAAVVKTNLSTLRGMFAPLISDPFAADTVVNITEAIALLESNPPLGKRVALFLFAFLYVIIMSFI